MRAIYLLCILLALTTAFSPALVQASGEQKTVIVREGKTIDLGDGAISFRLLKIKGYSIDVRIEGARRKLKLGETLTSNDGHCSITFHEISPETRIARFRTDCR